MNFIKNIKRSFGSFNLYQALLTFLKEFVVGVIIFSPIIEVFLRGCFTAWCLHPSRFNPYLTTLSLFGIYSAFVEPRMIKVRRFKLNLDGFDKDFRIVFFTDLHVGPHKRKGFVRKVVDKINKLDPDVILMGGDFITGVDWHPEYLEPMRGLRPKHKIFAVLGNHDYNINFTFETPRHQLAEKVQNKLKNLKIEVLSNESKTIEIGAKSINIVGVDDLWAKKDNLQKAYLNVDPSIPTILLCHNPDIMLKLTDKYKPELTLSGHTHGGSFRLPFLGPLFPMLMNTKLGNKYSKGLYKYSGKNLFITSGLGESVLRMRFLFNFPEIIVLEV